MEIKRDFSPADVNEERDYSFDFSNDLEYLNSEKLVSAVWTCTVVSGTDPGAAGHIFGSAAIDPTGMITSQRIKGLLVGCRYRLLALATTTNAQHISLWSFVDCLALT